MIDITSWYVFETLADDQFQQDSLQHLGTKLLKKMR